MSGVVLGVSNTGRHSAETRTARVRRFTPFPVGRAAVANSEGELVPVQQFLGTLFAVRGSAVG